MQLTSARKTRAYFVFDVRVAAPRRRCPTYTARLRTDPHLRLTGFRLTRRFGFAQATGSLTIGGVDDIKTTVVEVHNIARRELGPSHLSSGCDLCACVAERSSAWQCAAILENSRTLSFSNSRMRPLKSSADTSFSQLAAAPRDSYPW
jgi:hypothetical protein